MGTFIAGAFARVAVNLSLVAVDSPRRTTDVGFQSAFSLY
jgi:hypothetical protein